MIGVIATPSISEIGHSLFENFVFALKNYIQQPLKKIRNADDLNDVNILIIVDELYGTNTNVWKTENFINELNKKNIKTVIFNFEKIHQGAWTHNIDWYKQATTINNLQYIFSDVNDIKVLNGKILNKQLLSKDTKLPITLEQLNKPKKDRILFLGQTTEHVYTQRRALLTELSKKNLPIDIITSDRKYAYDLYTQMVCDYKYILNPIGSGHFLNLRFYEALKLGCIPIQQVTDQMLESYPELHTNVCYTFKTADDIKGLPEGNYNSYNYTLEQYFEDVDLKSLYT